VSHLRLHESMHRQQSYFFHQQQKRATKVKLYCNNRSFLLQRAFPRNHQSKSFRRISFLSEVNFFSRFRSCFECTESPVRCFRSLTGRAASVMISSSFSQQSCRFWTCVRCTWDVMTNSSRLLMRLAKSSRSRFCTSSFYLRGNHIGTTARVYN
jgi:hypothetical protein